MIDTTNPDTEQPKTAARNIPAVFRTVYLTHEAARYLYTRVYEIGNRALYQLETMPRLHGASRRLAQLERNTDERLRALSDDLADAIQQVRQKLAQNGILWDKKPMEGDAIEALVSARRSGFGQNSYPDESMCAHGPCLLALMEQFDVLAGSLDVAQRNDVLTKQSSREEIYRWQRRLKRAVLAVAGTIHKEADVLLNPPG